MKPLTLSFSTLLLSGMLVIFSSCKGQNTTVADKSIKDDTNTSIAVGDTVKELCKNIMVVFQDSKNNHWFGSWENGLYKYDGKTMIHYTTKHGLSHNRINEIKEDKYGNIYFNTSGGINKFDGKTFTKISVTISLTNKSEWKLQPDDLWFTSPNYSGSVYRYDGKVLHQLTFPPIKVGDKFFADNPRSMSSPYAVYTIYKDTKGNIWFGTAALGVCRYNGKSIDWITESDVNELHNGPANGVRSILEDKNGKFWFNTNYIYTIYPYNTDAKNPGDSSFTYKREKNIGSLDGNKDGNMHEYLSITKDNNNNIWIATYMDGVWCYNAHLSDTVGQGEKITHYPITEHSKNINVFSIYKDNHGDLWLGTHMNGAYKFNGKSFEKFRL